MKKLGSTGLKWLKIIHILFVILFFGGIMSSVALNFGMSLSDFDEVYTTYNSTIIISDNIVRYGAQGTLIIGILYGILTNWGFFRHKWVAVKWAVFIVQTLIGILVVDKLMVANMAILEAEKSMALSNPAFMQNHTLRQYAVMVQIGLTIFLIGISVLRPWKKKAHIK